MSSIYFDDELLDDAARLVGLYREYLALSDYEIDKRNLQGDYGSFTDFMAWLEQVVNLVSNSKRTNTPKPNVSNRPNR